MNHAWLGSFAALADSAAHTIAVVPEPWPGEASAHIGLTIRRIPNPRWRAPSPLAAGFAAPAALRVRALDVAGLRLMRQDGAGAGTSEWEARAGEETPGGDRIGVAARGASRHGRTILRTVLLHARRDRWSVAAGDVPPVSLAPAALPLHGLRGASLAHERGERGAWSAAVGASSPASGSGDVRLATAAFRDVRFDVARLSASLAGFARGVSARAPITAGDSLAGGGGQATMGWTAAIPGGSLAGSLLAQAHDLDGLRATALQHLLAWRMVTPGFTAELRDQRGTPRLRRLSAGQLPRDPGNDTRASVQSWLPGGRIEWHATAYARSGGDPTSDVRTLTSGGSGSFAATWRAGADGLWERRAGVGSHRLAIHLGRSNGAGLAWTARGERRATAGDPARLQLGGETLLPLGTTARLAVQPRMAWWGDRIDEAALRAELTTPVDRWSGRLALSAAGGAVRDRGFRPRLLDLALAFIWTPGSRDRAGVEVRRASDGGPARSEITLDWELQRERHAIAGTAARDTGSLRVRVVREGGHTPVADALVSLDGREYRFTDADGRARFDRVAPGVHVVAVDESSLPDHQRTVGPARAFASVERGVPAPEVVFVIARPAKRSQF